MARTRCASSTRASSRVPAPAPGAATGLTADMPRGLLARDAPEGRADRHADAREVALAQHVARHDLAGGEEVFRRGAVRELHARRTVHRDAEVGERNSGTKRPRE